MVIASNEQAVAENLVMAPANTGTVADAAPPRKAAAYFIIHRDEDGQTKTLSCASNEETRIFLEMLVSQGVSQHSIDLYRAEKSEFSVSFKPIVDIAPAGEASAPSI